MSGKKYLARLREHGFCIPHYDQMKLPRLITITVAGSERFEGKESLNIHFEILVRKLLNIFVRNPLTVSAVNAVLVEEVCEYGPAKFGLENERLLTPTLVEAMIRNPKVCYYCIYL